PNEATSLIKLSDHRALTRDSIVERGLRDLTRYLHVQDAEESINKAFSFFKQSRYEDAIAVCDSGLEMDARDSLLLHVLLQIKGASFVKQHKYNDGLQCIDRALEIDPTNPHCLELRNQVVRAYGPIEKSKAQARSSKPKVLVVDEPAIADTLVIILN